MLSIWTNLRFLSFAKELRFKELSNSQFTNRIIYTKCHYSATIKFLSHEESTKLIKPDQVDQW